VIYLTFHIVSKRIGFPVIEQSTANSQPSDYQDRSMLTNNISILSKLDQFDQHGLDDLKNAKLMDRVDTKFLIPMDMLDELLSGIKSHYSVLEINGKRVFTYQNTYFDTTDMEFYHHHHQGKLNRYKVRHRHYADSNLGFLEVKFKNNKGRTIKTRIKSSNPSIEGEQEQAFLSRYFDKESTALTPSQSGSYERMAFANEKTGERLTLDFNLSFKMLDGGERVSLNDFFVAELKQNTYNLRSPFSLEMSRRGIRSNNFSKYCMGCAISNSRMKQNKFKAVILSVNKLVKESS
jgi:hypothetical protein